MDTPEASSSTTARPETSRAQNNDIKQEHAPSEFLDPEADDFADITAAEEDDKVRTLSKAASGISQSEQNLLAGNREDRAGSLLSFGNPRERAETFRSEAVIPRIQTTPSIGVRGPFHHRGGDSTRDSALAARYRYYQRLDQRSGSVLVMPDHVVPSSFFSLFPFEDTGAKQHSIITIFSIWNTMLGTALLSMPWALQQAGFFLGIFLFLAVGAISFYTAYRVVESPKGLHLNTSISPEFSDVLRYFFGKAGEITGVVFSMVVLVGGVVVYWVLMSNFLYYTGLVIYDSVQPNSTEPAKLINSTDICDVRCIDNDLEVGALEKVPTTFEKFWDLDLTIPFYLLLLAYPLLNFESPTFFTKFNGLGTISVIYLLIFVTIKGTECGLHLDFSLPPTDIHYVSAASLTFPALTGTLGLSYFIHNVILTILRNQKEPKNNVRDLGIAYFLVVFTYIYIAIFFFATYPYKKSCIADNFLNNFGTGDLLSAVARLFLLFQMLAVFPLLMYLIRAQLSWAIVHNIYPGIKPVLILNAGVCCICVFFAIFLPNVGSILRFVGSFSSLVYIFTLPSLVHLKRLQMQGRLTKLSVAFHGLIILFGVANFFGQFAIL